MSGRAEALTPRARLLNYVNAVALGEERLRFVRLGGLVEAVEAAAAHEALALLETFVERTPCRFDHHGGCQEHGFLEPEDPWSPCPMAEGRRLLGWDEPEPTYDRRAARASDGGR